MVLAVSAGGDASGRSSVKSCGGFFFTRPGVHGPEHIKARGVAAEQEATVEVTPSGEKEAGQAALGEAS